MPPSLAPDHTLLFLGRRCSRCFPTWQGMATWSRRCRRWLCGCNRRSPRHEQCSLSMRSCDSLRALRAQLCTAITVKVGDRSLVQGHGLGMAEGLLPWPCLTSLHRVQPVLPTSCYQTLSHGDPVCWAGLHATGHARRCPCAPTWCPWGVDYVVSRIYDHAGCPNVH